MDPTALAPLFRQLNPTVWLITVRDGARRGGLIATFAVQASIVPELPRMLLGLAKRHYTWELVEASRCFGMHLISEEQLELVWRFGTQSGRDLDKLAGLELLAGEADVPLLRESIGWLECRVEASLDTGDRTVYLAEVLNGRMVRDAPPLTMHRLLELSSAEQREMLKQQLEADARRDALPIIEWRRSQGLPQSNASRPAGPTEETKMRVTDLMPLNSLLRDIYRLFGSRPMATGETADQDSIHPLVDISETPEELHVTIELPGLRDDDVHVTLSGNTLQIRGDKQLRADERSRRFLRIERSYGSFQRVITLPGEVDGENVAATLQRGILSITLKKTGPREETRRIPVHRAE